MKATLTLLLFGGKIFCFLVISHDGGNPKPIYNMILTSNLIGRVSFLARKMASSLKGQLGHWCC
jgi:hypothetical protein